MYIDCHVHCRDFEQKHKETIPHALEVAQDSGLSAIFDMPNTKPAVTTRERALERLIIAENTNSPVFYGLFIGLTSDSSQIQEAVQTYNDFFPKYEEDKTGIIGLKMYAGESVGDLAIIDPEKQKTVYKNKHKNI